MSSPSSGLPLVAALAAYIDETASSGQALPGENLLVAKFGSSRTAIREALARLEERGLIHRAHGATTAINPSLDQVKARLDEVNDKSDLIALSGFTPKLQVHRAKIVTLTDEETAQFDIEPGTLALRTTKVWSANDVRCTLATDTIPIGPGGVDLAESIDVTQPVWGLAEQLNGTTATWENVWLTSENLTEVNAWLLDKEAGDAVLSLTLHGVGPQGATAYWAQEYQTSSPINYALVRNIRGRRQRTGPFEGAAESVVNGPDQDPDRMHRT